MSLKRFQRRLIRILTVLVLLSAVFCAGLYVYRTFLGYNYDSTLYEEDLAAGIKADENITNIALFGLDPRDGDTQSHSDCTMIVSVDNTRGKIKLISLMRDSLVAIDGYGMDKLNAAYWAGGPSLAIRTLNENFGTDITEYIAVNFEQLVEIIDALDGVEIDVQQSELDELNRVIRDYGSRGRPSRASNPPAYRRWTACRRCATAASAKASATTGRAWSGRASSCRPCLPRCSPWMQAG